MSVLKVYFVQDEGDASLLWNGTKAYVFVGIVKRGYRFTYLTLIREWLLEIFPFGASPPSGKHFRTLVLVVTPTGVGRYSFDSFRISLPPEALGQNIYAGNLLSSIPGPTKWTGTQFNLAAPRTSRKYRGHRKMEGSHPRPAMTTLAVGRGRWWEGRSNSYQQGTTAKKTPK